MPPARTAALLALCLALAAPGGIAEDAAAAAVGTLQDSLTVVTEGLLSASGRLAAEDRAAALNDLLLTAADAAVLAGDASDPARADALGIDADRVARAAFALSRAVGRASLLAADPAKPDGAVLKAVRKASVKGGKLASTFLRAPTLGPILILEEVKARSAGFHGPGKQVPFRARVYPPGSCPGPIQIEVVDTAAVLGKSSVLHPGTYLLQPEVPFEITMGPDRGAARVVLTGCGRTSVRLLYNYGQRTKGSGGGGGGGGGSGDQIWHFGLMGTDAFVLGGFPYPEFGEDWGADITFHADLVKALGQHVADPTGTGIWGGMESPLSQQAEPSIVRLLQTEEPGVPVTAEVWWSTTSPTIHLRSTFDLIPHKFQWTASGQTDSVPVQAVELVVTSIGATSLAGTWSTIGGGSMSGNSSSGSWTGTRKQVGSSVAPR